MRVSWRHIRAYYDSNYGRNGLGGTHEHADDHPGVVQAVACSGSKE
jgi:hypothetical protein